MWLNACAHLRMDLEVSCIATGQAILIPWHFRLLLEASVPWHLEVHSYKGLGQLAYDAFLGRGGGNYIILFNIFNLAWWHTPMI